MTKHLSRIALSFLICYSIALSANEYHAVTMAPAQLNQLYKTYAPLLKLHPKDTSSPSSINWFLPHASLRVRDNKTKKKETTLIPKGEVTSFILGSFRENPAGKTYYLDVDGSSSALAGPGYSHGLSNAEAYVSALEDDAGDLKLTYIFFFPNQGSLALPAGVTHVTNILGIGSHEGDWEHIDAYLRRDGKNYILDRVLFSRHDQQRGDLRLNGAFKVADDKGIISATGTHPVTFVAQNSHGLYPENHPTVPTPDGDITSDSGPQWYTWEHLMPIGTCAQPAAGQGWINYAGVWGSTLEASAPLIGEYHGNSPAGPCASGWLQQIGDSSSRWIKISVNGKVVGELPIHDKVIEKRTKSRRYSDFFNMELFKRFSKIRWVLVGAEPNSTFEIWTRKLLKTDEATFTNLHNDSITTVPSDTIGLYVANVQGLGPNARLLAQAIE